ncbi:hybrid sensor histidine kinase/response regulator [Candidatus Symbiobacter mobilis]|uniref:Chemotaxic protein CheY n=1 Tax=Candidatus Symbiobacter mobilis CR TaxID=946483 RepID=U5NA65_9BURK|nr:hybrid sensor histidine kinase/response regulator [Candidatus Symbiobacter mobilis]AGX88431.1 chemotaxic protein CheY [Candidatus Symbiobacter mobilis CR]
MNLHQLSYLVVDDLELMRAVTVNQLRGMGCDKIKMARNGAEALEMLRLGKYDVVLSDWNMPVMSGLDLLKAIRADAKLAKLPFLMITAEAERRRIEMVINAGVTSLLVKPYNAGSLKARLEFIFRPRSASAPRPAGNANLPPPSDDADGFEMGPTLEPSRILVVDDYPVSLRLLEKMFKDEYQVLSAADGEAALALCDTDSPPDLILMDVLMPGMDGFEVVRRLRERPATAQLPVIFVTGLTDDEARLKGMELGAVDFVSKTSDPKALRARVRNFIQFVDMRRKLQADYDSMLEAARTREDAENISRHDLKGSLAGIVGMVQALAEDDSLAPQHVAQLRLVEQTAQQAMNMVNLAGDLYKIEMGQYRLRAVPVEIGEVLHRIVDLFRPTFSDKRLTIEVDTDTPVGTELPQALGDPMLCHSLFQNLLKNACEAAPPDTRVTVHLKDESPLRVLITNSGVVPATLRARFFEKFATSGKVGGSGLGTYSAQMLAKAQNGSITMVTSDELHSTTVTVTLPRHSQDAPPLAGA